MPMLPLPIVVAIVLLTLVATSRERLVEDSTGRAFFAVLCLYALSLTLISIRWVWDVRAVLPLAGLVSLLCVVLLYLAFLSLGREGPAFSSRRDGIHLVGFLVLITTGLLSPRMGEVVFIGLHSLYAVLLLRLALKWPDSLRLVRLGRVISCQQALWVAAIISAMNVLIEIAISISFIVNQGKHAAAMVGYANVPLLFLLGLSAVRAGGSRSHDATVEGDAVASEHEQIEAVTSQSSQHANRTNDGTTQTATPVSSEVTEEGVLMQSLQSLLLDQKLYADTELNLSKLARKSGVPARKVSRAINAQTGLNVSQWVNAARIEAARELLEKPHCSVNEAMMDAGFLTRSNFYREFRRIHKCSPGEWRDRHL